MKRNLIWSLVVAGVVAPGTSALAQTNQSAPAAPPILNRPTVVPPLASPDRPNLPSRPDRPPVPGQPSAPAGMQDLVKDYQTARQALLRQQQELSRKLSAATEEQRAAIRQQLKENLQQWREFQKNQIIELREQAKDIKNSVPNIRDVIDSGGGEGRGR